MNNQKYLLQCVVCGHKTPDFGTWFEQNQVCPTCGSKHSEVWYQTDYTKLPELMKGEVLSFWQYLPFLPLNNAGNIVTCTEGGIPVQQWGFLEEFAKKQYGLDIRVHVYRNDLNGGTGTFKDVAASLAASIFKEYGVKQYCVASTGNTATSYATYLSMAGVNCSVFLPDNALKASEAFVSAFGQQVFRVKGDYAKTKVIAAGYSNTHHILMSAGNIDPIRVEAKKTMVFEWLRQMGKMPDVYIQAVSGGTGPIAIDKGVREIQSVYPGLKNPRFILIQPDKCDPMVQAWDKAEKDDFPDDYEKEYPIIENPETAIPTLATGHPATYPIIAKLVKATEGSFISISEEKIADFARLIAYERKVMLGPASAVCISGFFGALKKGLIKDGETVLLNVGEGVRRAPEFVDEMLYASKDVDNVDQCTPHTMESYRSQLWDAVTD
ncbi:MAG: pyridoxal-phosphate dependent enzyme [Paludibacter sp.]|nr:pyridoxal-phosphate dependent enzyme [Paludibacter sp.]